MWMTPWESVLGLVLSGSVDAIDVEEGRRVSRVKRETCLIFFDTSDQMGTGKFWDCRYRNYRNEEEYLSTLENKFISVYYLSYIRGQFNLTEQEHANEVR